MTSKEEYRHIRNLFNYMKFITYPIRKFKLTSSMPHSKNIQFNGMNLMNCYALITYYPDINYRILDKFDSWGYDINKFVSPYSINLLEFINCNFYELRENDIREINIIHKFIEFFDNLIFKYNLIIYRDLNGFTNKNKAAYLILCIFYFQLNLYSKHINNNLQTTKIYANFIDKLIYNYKITTKLEKTDHYDIYFDNTVMPSINCEYFREYVKSNFINADLLPFIY